MLHRITRIENAGPDMRARRIFFGADPIPRTTSAAVVKRLSITIDMEVDRDVLEHRIGIEEIPLAKERALQLLGYRERSAAELRQRLKDGGYPVAVAAAIVERYQEVELIDDARFAHAWTRSRFAAGYGKRRISRELAEKGVDPALVEVALEQASEGVSETAFAVRSLRGRTPCDRRDAQRLIKRLLARGFSVAAARAAVEPATTLPEMDAGDQLDGHTPYDLR